MTAEKKRGGRAVLDGVFDLPPCPNGEHHVSHPLGYELHRQWAKDMAVTHVQIRCPGCGLYCVWVPFDTDTARASLAARHTAGDLHAATTIAWARNECRRKAAAGGANAERWAIRAEDFDALYLELICAPTTGGTING